MSFLKSSKHSVPVIISGAEPFFFPGNETGILLIHGFTGCPREMRFMGEYLHNLGCTCLGIRLAGHATQVNDLDHVRWQDWCLDVLDGISMLQCCTKNIFLAGLSLGGALALYTASQVDNLTGVIAMSTPNILSTEWRLNYAHLFKHVVKKIEKGAPDWLDTEMYSHHLEYPYFPTAAIVQVNTLIGIMRANLSKINTPVCLVHSKTDQSVPLENMYNNYASIGSSLKDMVVIERGSHTMTCDSERLKVFTTAHTFIQKVIAL